MTENRKAAGEGGLGEGIRTGIGILTAFKEAIEETLEEAIARGEVSPERAKTLMKEAADRVQFTLGEARGRLDLVSRREFDALRREVEELRHRVDLQESRPDEGSATASSDGGSAIPVD